MNIGHYPAIEAHKLPYFCTAWQVESRRTPTRPRPCHGATRFSAGFHMTSQTYQASSEVNFNAATCRDNVTHDLRI